MKLSEYVDEEEKHEALGRRVLTRVTAPRPPLLLGHLDPLGWSLIVGDRGAGKTALAAYWVSKVVEAGGKPAILDYEDNEDQWRRLLTSFGVALGNEETDEEPAVEYFDPVGPIDEIATTLRAELLTRHCDYLVIDSAMLSVAGSGKEGRVESDPMRAKSALRRIGLPSLMISHISKSSSQDGSFRAYGSSYWENLSDMVMTLRRLKTYSELAVTKSRHYPTILGREYMIHYDKDDAGFVSGVRTERKNNERPIYVPPWAVPAEPAKDELDW